MDNTGTLVRALQLGERIDIKGLEREDAFSSSPLAFRTRSGGTVALFRSGAAVFFNMTPLEEEELIQSLAPRIIGPLDERESETARLVVKPDEEELVGPSGALQLKSTDQNRLLLVAAALAQSVSLGWDERRISTTFDSIGQIAESLKTAPSAARAAEAASRAHRGGARRPAPARWTHRPRREARRALGPSSARALLGQAR